jgi:hypothetical protein
MSSNTNPFTVGLLLGDWSRTYGYVDMRLAITGGYFASLSVSVSAVNDLPAGTLTCHHIEGRINLNIGCTVLLMT